MKLVAKKPCRFGGKQYYIGQDVPEEAVLNLKKFIDNGTLIVEKDEEVVETPESDVPKKSSKRSKKSGDEE